ncbi:hypothetical protein ACQ4PT_042238 [Festuca glaucescens]
MAFTETASRKLLHGAGGAIVRVVAADGDTVRMSFGLGGLWQLIVGLLGSVAHLLVLPFEVLWRLLQTAVAGAAHLLLLPFEALWHLLQATAANAAAGISNCFDGLWHLIHGLVANLLATAGNAAHVLIVPFEALCRWLQIAAASVQGIIPSLLAALSSAAHLLLLPFEALWHLLQATAANAAAGISNCFDGLWHLIHGFANLLATVGNAAHVLIVPFEALCRWLQIAAASVQGIFPSLLAALSSAAHKLVLPFEAFGRWIQSIVADAAASISIGLDGFWPLIRRSFASILATLTGAADELVPALEAFWRWVKTTAAVALPFVLCIAVVVSLVALVWYCGPLLLAAAASTGKALMSALFCLHDPALGIAKALVHLVCWTAQYLHVIAMAIGRALSYLLPVCMYCCQCCASATMKAPGAAGFLISRAAFVADPRLYFQILRSAGSVVASAIFSTPTVASVVAAPVARLFRA